MKLRNILTHGLWTLLSLLISVVFVIGCITLYFELQLPDVAVLKDMQLQVPLQIYTQDEKLIAEFGAERRDPIMLNQVPKQLINAVLATEDQRYFEHAGIDLFGLLRASIEVATTGTKSQGGSTITMQVARNFFLTRKKTYTRKIKEVLLALKIDSEFSKEKILELYLNQIYFGNHAYGISAAAQVYFGKQLNELTLPEMALLAGLPKAPSSLNPLANLTAAKDRRNHVLQRMYERSYIDKTTYEKAINTPVIASYHGRGNEVEAPYVAEMVRDAMLEHFGDTAYAKGYKVYTTVSSHIQNAANSALHNAVISYDQRHGYRGPLAHWEPKTLSNQLVNWSEQLKEIPIVSGMVPAVVIHTDPDFAEILFADQTKARIPLENLRWIKNTNNAADILPIGDVIRARKLPDNRWQLVQVPEVEGALVALNPQNGAIVGLTGGFDYYKSNYNRVIQAERQPGSSFKPFIYSAALDKGYTFASIINDAPIVVSLPGVDTLWRPQNSTHKFYGPTRLRVALTESRNLVSVRLLRNIGINYAIQYSSSRFGFDQTQLPKGLSLALGSALVTPLELANGYAVFANGGYKVKPYLIDHISDNKGKVIYQANPKIACELCDDPTMPNSLANSTTLATRTLSPQTAYLMTSVLKDVIATGTGKGALALQRNDLAGKTGTTNEQMDAWFSGFNGDIVATAWVGFDQPRSLYEYGAQAALPMWINFMHTALAGKPSHTMSEPPGIVTARIDPETGLLAHPGQSNAIFELFRETDLEKLAKTSSATSMTPHQNAQINQHHELIDEGDVRIPTPLF